MARDKFKAKSETEAINFHGTFFKKAVRDLLEEIPGMSVREEYPVLYEDDAAIDLLATYHVDTFKHFIPMECKRALPTAKHWLFFPVKRGLTAWKAQAIHRLEGCGQETKLGITTTPIISNAACLEGLEIETDGDSFYANPGPIWEAAEQISRNFTGFVLQERSERQRITHMEESDAVAMFPMLITTAKLYIAKYDDAIIDLGNGNYPKNIEKNEVPFLSLNHPFIPQRNGVPIFKSEPLDPIDPNSYFAHYEPPYEREVSLKQSVVVVNAMYLKDFFAAFIASVQSGNPQKTI